MWPLPSQVELAEERSLALVAQKFSRLTSPVTSPAASLESHRSVASNLGGSEVDIRDATSPDALHLMRVLYHRRAKNRRLLKDASIREGCAPI